MQSQTMEHLIGLLLWTLTISIAEASIPCALKDYGQDHKVCVCNSTYCDTIDRVPKIGKGKFIMFVSTKDGLRFNKTSGKLNTKQKPVGFNIGWLSSPGSSQIFTVNCSNRYQTMMGFGGAFTDSAGINIFSLGKYSQEHLFRSYFSEAGIEYNLGRLPIGGTDFSTHPYSYDDGTPDPKLENFKLAKEDLKYKIPMIERATNMSVRELHLVAASWSPPPWMKTNNQYSGFAFLKDEYYDLYAKYIIRFLDEYKKHNVKVWAVSTGNEPSNGIFPINRFNSLGWTPLSIAKWIVNFFGPQIRNSTHCNTTILAFDDQRLFLPFWIKLMVRADKKVLKYIDGIAVHWYWDFLIGPEVVYWLHEEYPQKFVLYTEACVGDKPWEKKIDIGSWERGEKYLADIIQNMNVWVTGWMDWNLALDLKGGPTWVKNHVDCPILVNATADEFYKQPMFYGMGHASKFIERGAVRIEISPTESNGVFATAVQNPDGRIVVVLLNKNASIVPVSIQIGCRGWINTELPAYSFATILC